MERALISNPPYNMKWSIPPFAQMQPRFFDCDVPPENNANFAFVLTAIQESERAVLLLPAGILAPSKNKKETAIRKYMVDKNLIRSVIINPGNMFESTGVETCILVLDRNKQDINIVMIDARNTYTVEKREQNGQFGGKSHEGRKYVKELNTFSQEQIEKILITIEKQTEEVDFSKVVTCQRVSEDKYNLLPSHYFDVIEQDNIHRPYEDIIDDLNRVIKDKNIVKLTINETIAKSLGIYEFGMLQQESRANGGQISDAMEKIFGKRILKDDYISLTKKKMEIKFENTSKEEMSQIFRMMLQMYKQHIMYLNDEENRYLVELRDALLPDLMSGKIELDA